MKPARLDKTLDRARVLMLRPVLAQMPLPVQSYDEPFLPFGKAIVDATHDLVSGYAFDLAAYLTLGAAGAIALERTIAYARTGDSLTILHGAFMSAAYASAAAAFNVDAVTLASVDPEIEAAYHAAGIAVFRLESGWLVRPDGLRRLSVVGADTIDAHRGEDFAARLRAALAGKAAAVTLAQRLINAGLIQFGWFQQDGEIAPVALHLDMLGSYPDLLEAAARDAQTVAAGIDANRLLCAADALPFGIAFSLHSRVPLVYSRGSSDAPVYDLVGAYDIGHPALLLANSVGFGDDYQPLINMARRVGLETHTLLTIVECRPAHPDGIAVVPLLRLADVARELGDAGRLAAGHVRAVLDWCGEAEQGE